MKPRTIIVATASFVLGAGVLTLPACEKKPATSSSDTPPKPTAALPANLFLASDPGGAKPVEQVRGNVKPGDTITIQGRVGGSMLPFVEGRAVVTIVGPDIMACADHGDDHCKTPWDYCCETAEDIAQHSATIQVVDDKGALLRASLKGEHGLKELSDIIVVGKVAPAQGEVLVVNATGIYIAKK
ncbi:MAG: hypothetical protein JNK58_10045 [Phycisphaerae bacterium]|nr:hypothetical protein [Phycisphaerae bacterium]